MDKLLNSSFKANNIYHTISFSVAILSVFLFHELKNNELGIIAYLICFCVLAGICFIPKFIFKPIFWILATGLLSIALYFEVYQAANHHWVLAYLCIILGISLSFSKIDIQEKVLRDNAKILLWVIMFFAGFQKLLSNNYCSGSYFTYMFLTDSFFQPIIELIPEVKDIFAHNIKSISKLNSIDPNTGTAIRLLAPPIWVSISARIFAFIVLLGEIMFPFLYFLNRNPKLRNLSLILLIWGIFLTRLETGFLSIVAILGYAHCPTELYKIRLTYLVSILFFFVLIIFGVGYE